MAEHKKRTADVSMNDVEALAEDAESASNIYLEAAQSRPTPSDEQQSILAGNADALGVINAELVHEKHQRDEAQSVAHCANCGCNHDQLCPEGWSEVASGHCSGPVAYDGPCMAFYQFNDMWADDKTEYERACLVCWPCRAQA